ncbi:uncharacterized protein LOC120816336 [Gasterosteus aculeatus]
MAPRGRIAVTTALLCFILALLGPAPAALRSNAGKACGTSYNRKPVPFQRIRGYKEQTTREIVFYMVKKNATCAVHAKMSGLKLKKTSKAGTAGDWTPMRKVDLLSHRSLPEKNPRFLLAEIRFWSLELNHLSCSNADLREWKYLVLQLLGMLAVLKKGVQSRHKHHIEFSQRRAMASLAFVSLLLVAIVVSTASAQGGLPSCCQKIRNTRIHRGCLKSYYKQLNPPCAKTAIVFITVKGKRICAAPENWWTKKSMAYLDRKKPATPTRTQHHCSPKLS